MHRSYYPTPRPLLVTASGPRALTFPSGLQSISLSFHFIICYEKSIQCRFFNTLNPGRVDDVIFRLFKSILFFVNWISLYVFHFLLNIIILCLLLLYFDLDVMSSRDFFISCLLCFFPYSRLFSYRLRQFLCLISFLLFPCASVWENTRAWVPHFL